MSQVTSVYYKGKENSRMISINKCSFYLRSQVTGNVCNKTLQTICEFPYSTYGKWSITYNAPQLCNHLSRRWKTVRHCRLSCKMLNHVVCYWMAMWILCIVQNNFPLISIFKFNKYLIGTWPRRFYLIVYRRCSILIW